MFRAGFKQTGLRAVNIKISSDVLSISVAYALFFFDGLLTFPPIFGRPRVPWARQNRNFYFL